MAFTTKIIHDSSPDMGDSPVEITEQGRPASVGLQGLTPNTVRYVRAELYEDGAKVDSDETSFQTLPVGTMTVTYGQYRRTGCHEHYVTYTYTSTYAPSSAILHVTAAGGFTANYQGAIDSQNNTILFDCDDWSGGVAYTCTATLTDIYGEEQTSAVTTLTSGTINAISCAVSGVPTQTSVTLSIDKCLDGGFYNGYVEWWPGTDDPDTDLPQGHSYFQETDSTVTVTGLAAGTEYIFRVSATLDDMQTVARSAYVRAATAHDYSNDYFYLENTYNGTNTFTLTKNGTPATSTLAYSFDKTNWTKFGLNSYTETVTVPQGGRIYLRSSNGLSKSNTSYVAFRMSKSHTAGGHIASLLDYRQMGSYSTTPTYSLYRLFYQDTALTDASGIGFAGVTDIGQRGCQRMFEGCTSLETAPALPATKVIEWGYERMFAGCTSLAAAPALQMSTLYEKCYQGMFSGCTSLTSAPALPAMTLATNCYASMFYGCTSLTAAPALPATTLANSCYEMMFDGCTSLASAPALPATTLAEGCYWGMFWDCTSLSAITCLATDISATNCTYNWVNNVAASGTFTKDAPMSGWTTGQNGIPSGWTVQDYREPAQ